jgi:hypothetical protein
MKKTIIITLALTTLMLASIGNIAKADYYDTASINHKKWAKEFYQVSDKERYTNVHKAILDQDVKLKFKTLKFPGINMQSSLKSKDFAEVIGSNAIAYNGNTFHSIIVDHSKCYKGQWGNDCARSQGSSRTELKAKGEYTFLEGTEKWINYAVLPANNILFDGRQRAFNVGQCHPYDSGHRITWMIKFRDNKLELNHNFSSYQDKDGNWKKGFEKFRTLKTFDANEHNGAMDWTNIRINFKNSKNPDGKLHVWVDGKLAYEYTGPTNWADGTRDKCGFKFGLYTTGNLTSAHKEDIQNMTVFVDYMAFANTEEKLEKILAKDK